MPINTKYQSKFEHGKYYHIFNRSVNGTKLFSNQGNYSFFLQKFSEYLADVIDVYAWILLPNHFHFLVSVKKEIDCLFTQKEKQEIENQAIDTNKIIIRRFKNFFISYSQSYKRQQNIKTNIFAQHFKRSNIDSDSYFSRVIYYIHLNTAHHKMDFKWHEYPWSSYQKIIRQEQGFVNIKFVIEWFGGIEKFILYHQMQQDTYLFDEGA